MDGFKFEDTAVVVGFLLMVCFKSPELPAKDASPKYEAEIAWLPAVKLALE
ncbi:MAG: hypothetical protein NVS1B11_32310 [Terriglobales bacterium]